MNLEKKVTSSLQFWILAKRGEAVDQTMSDSYFNRSFVNEVRQLTKNDAEQ